MFEKLSVAPADPLMQALAIVRDDRSPDKADLGIGVYKDDNDQSPVFLAVKEAEKWLLETQNSKAYVSSAGSELFAQQMQKLLFGEKSRIITDNRLATIQTVGGSGALRVAAELIRSADRGASIWVPKQTWANHSPIFAAAGIAVKTYAYYDGNCHTLDFPAMMTSLQQVAPGDVVLLHGCCHNPSGADLDLDQWKSVGELLSRRGAVPFIDIAYQGFGEGVEADAAGLRLLAKQAPEALVAASCSKNFGLYRDRVGVLSILAANVEEAKNTYLSMLPIVRTCYSMPADHGAAVVAKILSTPELKAAWLSELESMRIRIKEMRDTFATLLNDGRTDRFDYLRNQKGMFSFIDVTPAQVEKLRTENHVYVIGNGRINVAGLTSGNVERVAAAIRGALGS